MQFHLIANSRLGPVGLWDWREGRNEAATTVRAVLEFLGSVRSGQINSWLLELIESRWNATVVGLSEILKLRRATRKGVVVNGKCN
jgi:hypothetical protein